MELFDHLLGEGRGLRRVLTATLANRSKIFPVNRVVDVSSKVEFDSLAKRSNAIVVKVSLGVYIKRESTFELFESSVEVVDIGLMMLFVVGLKHLAADDRLKGGVAVLKVREYYSVAFCGEPGEQPGRYYRPEHTI